MQNRGIVIANIYILVIYICYEINEWKSKSKKVIASEESFLVCSTARNFSIIYVTMSAETNHML